MKPKAIVLTGEGINCDLETMQACEKAGALTKRVHINDLIANSKALEDSHLLAIPGGFSFGDDLGAGRAFANKLVHAVGEQGKLFDSLTEFIEGGKAVIGICNGFQILVKSGLLPALNGNYGEQQVTIFFNDSGRFEDRWVKTRVLETDCIFTNQINSLDLPCRHGEGKFIAPQKTLKKLWNKKLIVMQYADINNEPTLNYPQNPNGSMDAIAGICNEKGNVLGLMPHPEAFLFSTNHPQWLRKKPVDWRGRGLMVFENAVNYVKKEFG